MKYGDIIYLPYRQVLNDHALFSFCNVFIYISVIIQQRKVDYMSDVSLDSPLVLVISYLV